MKKSYTTPKLVYHGDVTEITQVLGKRETTDFVFTSGDPDNAISDGDDLGSRDITLP
ncbi:MAG: lasso peptide [Nostocaceae cyanobacterium]|nr:lasso peptide [Nostocaceae cyanobacterium]